MKSFFGMGKGGEAKEEGNKLDEESDGQLRECEI